MDFSLKALSSLIPTEEFFHLHSPHIRFPCASILHPIDFRLWMEWNCSKIPYMGTHRSQLTFFHVYLIPL